MAGSTPNRERILSAAQRLTLSKGFPATTVDEVCEAAGVTKGGFYYHFKSKDELALALVDHYFDSIAEALGTGPHTALDDPVEKALAFLDRAVAVVRGPVLKDGCVLGSMTLDLSATHPQVRAAIADRFSALASSLEEVLASAIDHAGREAELDAGTLARQFLAVLQGSIIMAKAHAEPELMPEALSCFRDNLASQLTPKGS